PCRTDSFHLHPHREVRTGNPESEKPER
ncbi:hypothetical protein, partial [Escherichia coli]